MCSIVMARNILVLMIQFMLAWEGRDTRHVLRCPGASQQLLGARIGPARRSCQDFKVTVAYITAVTAVEVVDMIKESVERCVQQYRHVFGTGRSDIPSFRVLPPFEIQECEQQT